jgi:hypothetical protein
MSLEMQVCVNAVSDGCFECLFHRERAVGGVLWIVVVLEDTAANLSPIDNYTYYVQPVQGTVGAVGSVTEIL